MTPLLGFTPDAPTTTAGVIVDCSQWIPYEAGMKAAPSAVAQGASALAAAVRGAATVTYLDNTKRVIVGTSAALYSLSGTTFTDQSRFGGYTLGTGNRWSIVSFGSTTYASSPDNVIQTATSGAFGNVSGSPQAKILVSMLTSGGGFVFAFNTEVSKDQWKCSAVNNGDDWTVDPTVTLCNTGRLLGAEGPITAAAQLGSDIVAAYKNRSIYLGEFVGVPEVWRFREIPGIGCVGVDALVNLGNGAHFFIGEDGFYIFDGTRPISVGDGQVNQWFIDNSSADYRSYSKVVFDRDAKLVWVFFPAAGSTDGTLNRTLVYHLGTKQWGRADRTVEYAFTFSNPSETWDGDSASWDSDTTTWDQQSAGTRIVAIFDSAHTMYLLNGTPGTSSFTLHDIGDDSVVTRLTEFTLRYMTTPTTASITAYYSMATGGVPSTGASVSAYDVPSSSINRFNIRQSARWHRLQPTFTGQCKVSGYNVPDGAFAPVGNR